MHIHTHTHTHTGAASCRQQHNQVSCQPPPPRGLLLTTRHHWGMGGGGVPHHPPTQGLDQPPKKEPPVRSNLLPALSPPPPHRTMCLRPTLCHHMPLRPRVPARACPVQMWRCRPPEPELAAPQLPQPLHAGLCRAHRAPCGAPPPPPAALALLEIGRWAGRRASVRP